MLVKHNSVKHNSLKKEGVKMFIGREKELKFLEEKLNSEGFEFGVLHGRRRVGKTVLIKEAIKNKNAIYFQAHQANMQINLELLSSLYGDYKKIGKITYNSMYELFRQFFLEPNLILVIDEFTYLTEIDKSFESMLQSLIDEYKLNTTLKLIISGSEIGMFENLFSRSKPLFNRQTFTIHLKECDYYESSLYYKNFSAEDKVKAYAIFGGLPYYLSYVDDTRSIKENVCEFILKENARFEDEVENLLISELRSIQEYQSILQAIQGGNTKFNEIDSKSKISNSAKTSKYIKELIRLEIIEKEIRFLDKPDSKRGLYKIKNNFISFYYYFIWKNISSKIVMEPSDFYDIFIGNKLEEYVSHIFEDICRQYLIKNFKKIHDKPIINIGRYWYSDKYLKKDVEIDICIKTMDGLHIYECKWTNKEVDVRILNKLKEKGKEVKVTKYGIFSKSGFSKEITNKEYELITVDELYQIK